MQLFVDLDGVLADFDGYFEQQFGRKLDRDVLNPPEMWQDIDAHGSFFRSLPPMPDALELWHGILHLKPIILTGLPSRDTDVEAQKRDWVAEHIGSLVPMVCCLSKHKYRHGKPGDVLIDDWHKYRYLWERMGGTFILHASARDSLTRIEEMTWRR